MRRRLSNLACLLSLLLCAATVVLWTVQARTYDDYILNAPRWWGLGFEIPTSKSHGWQFDPGNIRVPYALVSGLSAIAPILWLGLAARRWRRSIRRLAGACEHCGYDLRATPDRCPECGIAVPKKSEAAG